MKFAEASKRALRNIAKHGDTDIFPFLFEKHIFFDRENEARQILKNIHSDFFKYLNNQPPATIPALTQVGYTGFRWATQIEPFWNAYYLACVIMLADKIEAERASENAQAVFSYRYKWNADDAKLFKDVTWTDYRKRSLKLCENSQFVVVTDIADFYPRIYHHRIENALSRLTDPGDIPKRIMALLKAFSNNVSYGLPIGGPASRILSELALNAIDKQLLTKKIPFCRYADDFCLFCNDRAEAYRYLVLLSQKLSTEGLVLQKKKTKIQTVDEFRENSKLLDPNKETAALATDEEKLLGISIRYDPYSDNPDKDYEELKEAVNNVDIVGILGREIAKTAIDTTVTRQAINAVRALDENARIGAIRTLLDPENLEVLAPVFVTVMRASRGVYSDLDDDGKNLVDEALVTLYDSNSSYLLTIDLHIAYYIQALSQRWSQRKEEILIELFEENRNPLVRRLVLLTLANWKCYHWLSDIKQNYGSFNEWEKRAMILGSFYLGDEGEHWRNNKKRTWNEMESLIHEWSSNRFQTNQVVPV